MIEPFDRMMADRTAFGVKWRRSVTNNLDQTEKNRFGHIWEFQARDEQLAPGGNWRIWMIMAGRGFGKTRSGAEWVRMIAEENPDARIALVSSSLAEARAVMVEGESGLLGICDPGHRPLYEPSLHRIRFKNGAQAQLFSAAEPESLRGPQHSHARRSVTEGVLRQSCALLARCFAHAHGQGFAIRTSCNGGRFRLLPGQGSCNGLLDWTRGSRRYSDRGGLALHRTGPRNGNL